MIRKKSSEAFGPVLRQFRNAKNLTQDELAARMGIASPYISRLESGHKHPSLGMICKLAEALGVKASTMIIAMEQRLNEL